jgi:hypothetical protein
MFPWLMTRCDLASIGAPVALVTVIPNLSLVPGWPWSSTVVANVTQRSERKDADDEFQIVTPPLMPGQGYAGHLTLTITAH